jgi:hypothetical protein
MAPGATLSFHMTINTCQRAVQVKGSGEVKDSIFGRWFPSDECVSNLINTHDAELLLKNDKLIVCLFSCLSNKFSVKIRRSAGRVSLPSTPLN